MSRPTRSWRIPETPDGDQTRLLAAADRCKAALTSPMAQYPEAPKLGMSQKMILNIDKSTGKQWISNHRFEGLPWSDEDVLITATHIRPFTLKGEPVWFKSIVKSLQTTEKNPKNKEVFQTLLSLWETRGSASAVKTYVAHKTKGSILPEDGMDVWDIAEEYLYGRVFKVGDTDKYLSYIDPKFQQWCVARYLGDLLGILAYQEYLIHHVAPKACPELTKWSGYEFTIFERLEGEEKFQEKLQATRSGEIDN